MTSPETAKPDKPGKQDAPSRNRAAEMLDVLHKEQAVEEVLGEKQDSSDWQYVHYCRRGHIAFFYKQNPANQTIKPEDWFSTYKREDEPWMGAVVCQECSHKDEEGFLVSEEPVQVTYVPTKNRRTTWFVPDPRFIYRMPKSADKRKTIPIHRSEQLNVTAANVGVPNPDFPERVRSPRPVAPREEVVRG